MSPRKRRLPDRAGGPEIGALVTFTGICRGAESGEPIAALTPSTTRAWPRAEIARHVEEATSRWPLLQASP